jgi:murein DD-endopeptidase MepM/ murein hydrolase activator NlpD
VYSGFNEKLGNVVIVKNDTGDYSLYGHLLDGDRAKLGQRIWPEDTIGLVGSTGKRTTGPHLHYSIIGRDAHGGVENPGLSHEGGPIGVALNERNTLDPARYDNYDSRPRYLDRRLHRI